MSDFEYSENEKRPEDGAAESGAHAEERGTEGPSAENITAGQESTGAFVSYDPQNGYDPQMGERRFGGSSFTEEPKKQSSRPPRKAGRNALCGILAVALLLVTFFGGTALGRTWTLPGDGQDNGTQTGGSTGGQNSGSQSGTVIDRGELSVNVTDHTADIGNEGDFTYVVAKVKDTVVEIRTETAVNSAIYGDYVVSGAGSGVIIGTDGLILTCHHVIDGAGTVTVVLSDGKTYTAEVYGSDSWSDLALLKIDATGLPAATLATWNKTEDYSYLALGETVAAIGNPLGQLGGSISRGIISAKGRKVTVEGVPMTLLQIDASVNPGNSGGGLFNMHGELIGIVNAKSSGESVEGIGFAIPISDASDVVSQLYRQGYVSGRPYLGLYFKTSSDTQTGLEILSYDFNDELTGGNTIKSGDYLYSADGNVISSMSDLRTVLAGKKPGDTIRVQIERYARIGYGYTRQTLELELPVHEYRPVSGGSD